MSSRRVTTTRKSSAVIADLRQDTIESLLERFNPSPSGQLLQGSVDHCAPRVLLVDTDPDHSQQISKCLKGMGLVVETCGELRGAVLKLRANGRHYDLVVVNISNSTKPWGQIIHDLQEVACQSHCHLSPFFLCVSNSRPSPELRLTLEQKGARVAHEQ